MRFAILHCVYLIFRIVCFHFVHFITLHLCVNRTCVIYSSKSRSRLSLLSSSIAVFFIVLSILQLCALGNNFTRPTRVLALWRLAVQFAACHRCVEQCTMDILVCVKTHLQPYIVFLFLNFESQRLVEVRLPTMFLQYEPSSLSRLWLNVDGPLNECQVCMHKEKCQQWHVKSGGR